MSKRADYAVSCTKGDPWTAAVNHFSKLKARVSKENVLPFLYKNTTASQELIQLPHEVSGILCVGFSGKWIKSQTLILTAFSPEVYTSGFHSSMGFSIAQCVLFAAVGRTRDTGFVGCRRCCRNCTSQHDAFLYCYHKCSGRVFKTTSCCHVPFVFREVVNKENIPSGFNNLEDCILAAQEVEKLQDNNSGYLSERNKPKRQKSSTKLSELNDNQDSPVVSWHAVLFDT